VYEAKKNNSGFVRLLQPTTLFPTGRCHINFSFVKNPPLRCGLSSKFFDHLLSCLACVLLEYPNASDTSEEQADVSPDSVATTTLSCTSRSLDAEVQVSDYAPSLQWDNADLTSGLLQHDLSEYNIRYDTTEYNTINVRPVTTLNCYSILVIVSKNYLPTFTQFHHRCFYYKHTTIEFYLS